MATEEKQDPPTIPRLEELPEELVSNISLRLGIDDIQNFRLTCRTLEEKSFHEFAKEHFSQKCIIFTTDALKALLGIARSPRLAGHLHELYICPALFSDRVFNCSSGSHCHWHPNVRQSEAWRGYMLDQKNLRLKGGDLEMLTEAFKGLTGLTHLTFIDDLRRFRSLDVRGVARSARLTANTPAFIPGSPTDKEYYRYKNHVWKTSLQALAASGSTSLLHFNTELDQVKNSLSVAVNLEVDDNLASGLAPALQNIHCLGLNISSRKLSRSEDDDDDGIDTLKGGATMQKFSALTPSLKKLRLAFSYSTSSHPLFTSYMHKINLAQLTNLSLESCYLDSKPFATFISQLTSVTDLYLSWINMVTGTWVSVLKACQKLEKLNHLHLMWLAEKGERVCLVKQEPSDASDQAGLPPFAAMSVGGSALIDRDDIEAYLDESETDEDDEDEDEGSEDSEDEENVSAGFDESENDEDEDDDSLPDLESPVGVVSGGDNAADVDSDTDESMPDLEPQDAPLMTITDGTTSSADSSNSTATVSAPAPENASHDAKDSASLGDGPERGYYVCLKGSAQLQKYLPIFIAECNVTTLDEDDMLNGDPMNAFMNTLGAALGAGAPVNVFGNNAAGGATFTIPAMFPPPPPGPGPATG